MCFADEVGEVSGGRLPHDLRARLIELTPDGAAAADRVLGWFTEALADWSAQDRQTFIRLLARFADDVAERVATLEDAAPNDSSL